MLLTGKTVLVVEPEPFAAYALERRLRDLDARDVIVLRDADDARLRFARDGEASARKGSGGTGRSRAPGLAIIDFDECGGAAERLAAELRRRHVKVVRTTRGPAEPAGRRRHVRERKPGSRASLPTVRKPYDMIEIERAIGLHYGVMI